MINFSVTYEYEAPVVPSYHHVDSDITDHGRSGWNSGDHDYNSSLLTSSSFSTDHYHHHQYVPSITLNNNNQPPGTHTHIDFDKL